MTSISSLFTQTSRPSPRERVNTTLSNEVSAGTLSQTDATAISSALDNIDKSLQSSSGSSGSSSTSATPSREDMKSKMDSLIQQQVDNGTLTSDQASELKQALQSSGPQRGGGGPGGAGGAGGPPPGPPPGGDSDNDNDSSSSTSSSSSSSSSSATNDVLKKFLEQLQAAQASGASYSASGSTSASGTTSYVFDFTA